MHKVLLAGVAAAGLAAGAAASPAPPVVATILPIHGLTAAVMEGVGEPRLLLPPGTSPHAYSMKSSDAAALEDAELVIWVGDALETFLARSLDNLAGDARRLALLDAPGVELRHFARGHADHAHGDHDHADDRADDHAADRGDVDPHIWLSPTNAAAMTRAIAAALAELDPANGDTYRANAAATVDEIEALERALEVELAPVRDVPFIVFHDAYGYFEDAFGVRDVGAVTLSPDQSPGTAHVAELRRTIRAAEAVCVFAEPQFEPQLVETLAAGTDVRTGELDPVGADLEPGPDAYVQLMRELADDLVDCLAGED
ncbi:MAG: zinc ABC transporter substrate-binding protein [Alphaproteobacteria bacterium]